MVTKTLVFKTKDETLFNEVIETIKKNNSSSCSLKIKSNNVPEINFGLCFITPELKQRISKKPDGLTIKIIGEMAEINYNTITSFIYSRRRLPELEIKKISDIVCEWENSVGRERYGVEFPETVDNT